MAIPVYAAEREAARKERREIGRLRAMLTQVIHDSQSYLKHPDDLHKRWLECSIRDGWKMLEETKP